MTNAASSSLSIHLVTLFNLGRERVKDGREGRMGSEERGVREGKRGRVKEGEGGKEREIERGENWCN